ncbi:hypothetical protein [Methanotorris formicicus]|uniref:PBS lyase HEAT domain protein repeat-containing protein n=1 Tax=Methanotorris formicicus Mc-S-70 TaxID=647171 RepID=H1L0I2_9EURY|nr:hypothetical protein [Methanotorris formicicus]EHP84814.1 hypothetical protein MetfoDRAFT_1556 [Methanotorris formicicus Mc-S-70]
MNYKKMFRLGNRSKLKALKEIYNKDVDEILELEILEDVFTLVRETKEKDLEDIIYEFQTFDPKNREIIALGIKIIGKVGEKYVEEVYNYIPFLIKSLDSEFEVIRYASAEALAKIPSKLTIYAYPKLIKNMDNKVYADALVSLIFKAENKEAILLELYKNFDSFYSLYVLKKIAEIDKNLVYDFIPLVLKHINKEEAKEFLRYLKGYDDKV